MRAVAIGLLMLAAGACGAPNDQQEEAEVVPAAVSFDGGDYADQAAKIAHGKRLATLFQCNACHGADYAGVNFGEMIPLVEGLWASNISLTMQKMSDAQLERLLREGVHPEREIYLMPSKQTQFLSPPDMAALIAFLRTIPPVGVPTPLPPKGFEEAVRARLPKDYWLTEEERKTGSYANAADEVAYYAAHRPPDLGPQFARGRMIAETLCSTCHGAALDGVGEPAGDIQGALAYDDAAFDRLLIDSIDRSGKKVAVEWGFGHEAQRLTPAERRDVVAYVRALARARAREPSQR
jgi:mono/diheme cytochrome c family protein